MRVVLGVAPGAVDTASIGVCALRDCVPDRPPPEIGRGHGEARRIEGLLQDSAERSPAGRDPNNSDATLQVGQSIDVTQLDEEGTAVVDVTEMTLQMESARFRVTLMRDLKNAVTDMFATLREARELVDGKLKVLEGASYLDPYLLGRVGMAARSFASQADSLADALVYHKCPQEQVNEVEDLLEFFQQVDERVAAIAEVKHR